MKLSVEERLRAIEVRNKRVELDKKWETSWARRLSIAMFTYVVVAVYLIATGKDQPFINALVPPIGFVLSTLALKSVRDLWQSQNK